MKTIVSFIFLFVTSVIFSQTVKVISSEEFEKKDSSYDYHFFWNDEGMIAIKTKDRKNSNRDMGHTTLKG